MRTAAAFNREPPANARVREPITTRVASPRSMITTRAGRGTHQTVDRLSEKPVSADRYLRPPPVPLASVVTVNSLGPTKRSRTPLTGRGAHAGSPTLSTGQVGPAVTVMISDPECLAPTDWPQPSATTSSNQITIRHLTLSLTAALERSDEAKEGTPTGCRSRYRGVGVRLVFANPTSSLSRAHAWSLPNEANQRARMEPPGTKQTSTPSAPVAGVGCGCVRQPDACARTRAHAIGPLKRDETGAAGAGLIFGINRMRRGERGQATVEYAGLPMERE